MCYLEHMIKEFINEHYLCVLRKNTLNLLEVDYVIIEKPFTKIVNQLVVLCDNLNTTLEQVVEFLEKNQDLNRLSGFYFYCDRLDGAFQSFAADFHGKIQQVKDVMLLVSHRENQPGYNKEQQIAFCKSGVKKDIVLWHNAFSIARAYDLCRTDSGILSFSHRDAGWAAPRYQLSPAFSLEFKTNFGYGSSSYFYTKLRYKDIDIIPFSEWITYEYALFSEVIRYTRSHILDNKFWLEAMEFACEACNLSLTNENGFIEKYVVEECEKMVSGLEAILHQSLFLFRNRQMQVYHVDKYGHVLIEFRGEKISGALDFISKIIEFQGFASIRSFVDRIEECNRTIEPILVDESKLIQEKLVHLQTERDRLRPKYEQTVRENEEYEKGKLVIKDQMKATGELNEESFDFVKFEKQFLVNFPDYKTFIEEHNKIVGGFQLLLAQIENLETVNKNITSYQEKIRRYFEERRNIQFQGAGTL